MAGTLELREDAMWGPAGWVFDLVLERIASELSDSELARMLRTATTEGGSGYLDLRALGTDHFGELLNAAERAFELTERESPTVFERPEFHPGLVDRFRDLIMLMRADSRAHRQRASRGAP